MSFSVYAQGAKTSHNLLTETECKQLIALAQQGNKEARERLVEANRRLVMSFVHRFDGRGEEQEDLMQIGMIGLLKAIHHFDLNYNVCFSTYAVPVIMGEIRRYLRDNRSIRVSRTIKELAYKTLQVKEKFMEEHQQEPTVEQLAVLMERSKEDVILALESLQPTISIYEPIAADKDGNAMTLLEKLGDEVHSDHTWIEKLHLEQCLGFLTTKEQWVFRKRYLAGLTQQEIAKELQLSQAQISRLEKKALAKMKEFYKKEEA